MKKILILGSTGMIGRRIANEASSRGHAVTEATRTGGDGRLTLDATNSAAIAAAAVGHDAIVSAISPPRDGTPPAPTFLAVNRNIIEAAREADVRRVLVVGGAGTLLMPDDTRMVDQDWMPAEVKPEALAHAEVLELLRTEATDLEWSYLSPPGQIEPGIRTGSFTLGLDHAVSNTDGESTISAEDYAVAFVDELERGEHLNQRFTAAYG